MPQFTHHEVEFPFPVLTFCACFQFLRILLTVTVLAFDLFSNIFSLDGFGPTGCVWVVDLASESSQNIVVLFCF
jgi:hypothetical protein